MRYLLPYTLFVFLFTGTARGAQVAVPPLLFTEAQNAALRGEFSTAESLATCMMHQAPDDPTGSYARAALEQIRLFGCEGNTDAGVSARYVEQALRVGSARVTSAPADVWARYIMGLTLGLVAVQAVDKGSYWAAYRSGTASIRELERVLVQDPSFADARLALGTYYFWRGRAMYRWDWLPFVEDTRARGIAEMRTAHRDGRTTRSSAAGMLAWALIEQQDWNEALFVTTQLAHKFPGSRPFLTAHAEALIGLGRWEEAIAAYSKVLTTYDEEQQVCAGFVTALLKRAVALAKLGRCSEARRDLASVVTYRPPRGDQEFDNLRSMAKDLVARCGDESR